MEIQLHNVLLGHLAGMLGPMISIRGIDDLREFLDRIGWDADALGVDHLNALYNAVKSARVVVGEVAETIENGTGELKMFVNSASAVTGAVKSIVAVVEACTPPAGLQASDLALLSADLTNYLLDSYLRLAAPRAYSILRLIGVIGCVSASGISTPAKTVRRAMYRPEFDLNLIRLAAVDPLGLVTDRFVNGGTPSRLLAEQVADIAGPLLVDVVYSLGAVGQYGVRGDGAGLGLLTEELVAAGHMLIARYEMGDGLSFRLVVGLTDDTDGRGMGVVLAPSGELDVRAGTFSLKLSGNPGAILITSSGTGTGNGSSGLVLSCEFVSEATPFVRFGSATGTRCEIGAFGMTASGSIANDGVSLTLTVELKGIVLAIAAGDGDGFLSQILPSEPIAATANITLDWTLGGGLKVRGHAGLEARIAIDRAIGPVFLNSITLGLDLMERGLAIQVSIDATLAMGPLVVAVEGIGLRGILSQNAGGSPSVRLKPPTGIGLSIDTPTLKASGFLAIDTDRVRYVGEVAVSILNKFDITTIGIITTQRPDGSAGYSLLFLVSMTFPTPIPLGYNFYLGGAGGLLGLNRSVDVDQLQSGLRTGAADSILFPTDVVRRIDQIVRDLDSSFPQADGHFLVGPIALIQWNKPALITAKLGLIIEIATPVRIAILGVLRAALPDANNPILDLKVAFLGTVDIEKELLKFDASVYESYIGRGSFKFYLEGDMALRLSWGRQSDFVTSIGGFHPSYTPPSHLRLPAMRRMTLSLLQDNPRVTLSLYLAITTNTVQAGARIDFLYKVSKFKIVGELGMDVLFQLSPFHLDACMRASLSVRCGGTDLMSVRVDLHLVGPNPWIARGTGHFKVLFTTFKVDFEKRFGEEATNTLPDIEVLPPLLAELDRPENWHSELGAATSALIIQRPPDAPGQGGSTLVVDPAGRLGIGQRILPLDTDFSLFGTSRPTDATRVSVKAIRVGGAEITEFDPIFGDFAPAAFREMSDKDKLAAPAYESRPSGAQLRSGQCLMTDEVVLRPVAYELKVSDTGSGAEPVSMGKVWETGVAAFKRQIAGGVAGRSSFARAHARRAEEGKVLNIGVARERFAVASNMDLCPIGADGKPAAPLSKDQFNRPEYAEGVLLARSDAEQLRSALIAKGCFPAEELEIIPEAQLAA